MIFQEYIGTGRSTAKFMVASRGEVDYVMDKHEMGHLRRVDNVDGQIYVVLHNPDGHLFITGEEYAVVVGDHDDIMGLAHEYADEDSDDCQQECLSYSDTVSVESYESSESKILKQIADIQAAEEELEEQEEELLQSAKDLHYSNKYGMYS